MVSQGEKNRENSQSARSYGISREFSHSLDPLLTFVTGPMNGREASIHEGGASGSAVFSRRSNPVIRGPPWEGTTVMPSCFS
jgi:hypothetical protein